MALRRIPGQRAIMVAFAGAATIGSVLAGAGPAFADPADPTTPVPVPLIPVDSPPPPPPVSNNPMTPHQPPVAAAPAPASAPAAPAPAGPPPAPGAAPLDPTAPPPPGAPVPRPTVPNTVPPPGSSSGGGILGSLRDIWHQAQNPFLNPGDAIGGLGAPAPPPGAGPAPKLPPGYISTNAPGSETPATSSGGDSAARPALPPGYYPINGPVPPWYLDPAAPAPAPAP